MSDVYQTRLTLLNKIKDTSDGSAWDDFIAVYKNMILNWARYMGCNDAMADDVFQESIISLLKNLPTFEYIPDRGRFRSYLKTLVSRRVKDAFRRRRLLCESDMYSPENDNNFIAEAEDLHEPPESELDTMWLRSVVLQALRRVEQIVDTLTLRSFKLYAIDKMPVADVCRVLDIDREGTVYQQKSRVLKRISKELDQLLETCGAVSFSQSRVDPESPAILKCIENIILENESQEHTMVAQAPIKAADSRLSFSAHVVLESPVPQKIADGAALFLKSHESPDWVQLVGDHCSIGRVDSDVTIDFNGISSLHAAIYKENNDWVLSDQQSTNGTFLNGARVEKQSILKSGDVIHLSEFALVFVD